VQAQIGGFDAIDFLGDQHPFLVKPDAAPEKVNATIRPNMASVYRSG